MENKINWVRVWTGRDLLAGFLKQELEDKGITVEVKSQTASGLAAGFGTTGMARVYVPNEQLEKAVPLVTAFDERQQEE